MKNSWIGVLVCLVLILACNENDEVAPRSNPRFSVTYVQEIDAKGAEFMATVYDFGSDQIVEYGFVFSEEEQPKLGTGEVINAMGRPEKSFKLTGDHSMIKGKVYFVAAFIKTDKSIVYSESVSFTSQGSEGFVYEKVVGGPEVYFGDTLTIIGKKLSSNWNNYDVKVNGSPAKIILQDENSFKLIIPDGLGFGYPFDYDGKLVLSIKILDKKLEVNTDIQFFDPQFFESDKELRYDEGFQIRGKYLLTGDLKIIFDRDTESPLELPVISVSDTLITFEPRAYFHDLSPKFGIFMRGKYYEVEKSVKIKPTEILPGQQFKMKVNEPMKVKGDNFNPYYPYYPYLNTFISEADKFDYSVSSATGNEIEIFPNTYYAVPNPRFYTFYATNGGVKSTNFVTVENTGAGLAYMYTHTFPFNSIASGRSVSWRDKGIWLLDGKITEVDPKTRKARVLKVVDLLQQNIASSFAVIDRDVVYFSGRNEVIASGSGPFYSYDLSSGALTKLPDLPTKASTPKSAFISGGYLYFGGGFYIDEFDVQKVAEGYKFHLATRTWSKWDKKFAFSEYWDFETTFVYNGEVYGLVNEINDSDFRATRLMRFDNSREDWIELALYPYLGYSNGYSAMSIGNKVYFFGGYEINRIDMTTYDIETLEGFNKGNNYTEPLYYFLSEGKIYYKDNGEYLIYQVDPEYFVVK